MLTSQPGAKTPAQSSGSAECLSASCETGSVAPLGVAFNVHPVHLGVIFLANLELGFLCPPMGLNLFLSATRFHKPLPVLYRHALPFLLIMSIGVLFITYVPWVTMGLLRLLGKA